jgi:hypothetical protein
MLTRCCFVSARCGWDVAWRDKTVILPNGDMIKTRQRSRKSSAGWDATKL